MRNKRACCHGPRAACGIVAVANPLQLCDACPLFATATGSRPWHVASGQVVGGGGDGQLGSAHPDKAMLAPGGEGVFHKRRSLRDAYPPSPLRKHQESHESDGQTGSWCLDKAVLACDARHQARSNDISHG